MSITGHERQAFADLESIQRDVRTIAEQQPTLRDYFAAAALPALIAYGREAGIRSDLNTIAECAYDMADAMLKARSK